MENRKNIELSFISKKKLFDVLNPHLQSLYSFEEDSYEIETYNSSVFFFNVNRFDVVAKYIYADYSINNYDTNWHKSIYKEHIRAFSNNSFKEGDARKNSFKDYTEEFSILLKSIKEKGFNANISILPITKYMEIIDGAHRLSLSYLFNEKVTVVNLKPYKAVSYNYDFFLKKGLPNGVSDFIAFKYCELNKKARIVNLFPITNIEDVVVERILKKYGDIYYKKKINLTKIGQDYVVREMYLGEHWVGKEVDNFPGALYRSKISFDNKNELIVYVYIPKNSEAAIKVKAEIRKVINKGNYPIHINDTHKETIRLSQTYFNDNSIHFINHRKNIKYKKFNELFTSYKNWIDRYKYNREDFCIDASSVLSVYGLREGADLDFLYSKESNIETGINLIDCHNVHSGFYKTSIDNIIYNPQNYFYFEGYKFISIDLLKFMKKNRNEEKDIRDVLLIDSLMKKFKFCFQLKKNLKKISLIYLYKKLKIRIHRVIPRNTMLWSTLKQIHFFLKKNKK